MRKFLIAAVIVVLAISSCKKDDEPTTDCFDCTVAGVTTKYCYTDGEDHYVLTVTGVETNVPLSGASWITLKAGIQALCE